MAPAAAPRAAALLLAAGLLRPSYAREAFAFVGPTGDNALRTSGVWSGLYEAFAGGTFDKAGGVGIFAVMNTPHTRQELERKVLSALTPLYEEFKQNPGWQCLAPGGDCRPERLISQVAVNIHAGRDACAQAESMKANLSEYDRVNVYLSIPPSSFGSWAKCAVEHWGQGAEQRVHLAVEKPFGTSLKDADNLHRQIQQAGVTDANLHLCDHWLSFFMNKHLPTFRRIVQPMLGVGWNRSGIERIVVTQFEERGLHGRGGFFDGVGQVRDMVQSHLLQVLALAVIDPSAEARSLAKLAVLNRTAVEHCRHGQYDGFLLEPKLGYHPSFADATFSDALLSIDLEEWWGVPITIVTAKEMGELEYTIEFFQRQGPGVLTIELGKEETGRGGIRVRDWPLKDTGAFDAPAGGFDSSRTIRVTPSVVDGSGYVLQYNDPHMYFPKPYAVMTAALLARDYGSSFVTYPECQRSWAIVTSWSATLCLNPPPEKVPVYKTPDKCGNKPPNVCWQPTTVKDLYDVDFNCTASHDGMYSNVSLYRAKCHPRPAGIQMVV